MASTFRFRGTIMSDSTQYSQLKVEHNIVRDIYTWRRKNLSLSVLLAVTATWVVLEVYQFNFVAVASWVAMFIVTSAFVWGNLLRLFGKEAPNLSGMEISEQSVMEMANSIRELSEEVVRWMLHVGAEREWFVFARAVAGLWLLSVVGSFFDLLTFLYIGTLAGMIVPVLYAKYEYKLKEYWQQLREQGKRFSAMIDEKVVKKIKDKTVGGDQKKEHKTE